jgi:hypothetical protein
MSDPIGDALKEIEALRTEVAYLKEERNEAIARAHNNALDFIKWHDVIQRLGGMADPVAFIDGADEYKLERDALRDALKDACACFIPNGFLILHGQVSRSVWEEWLRHTANDGLEPRGNRVGSEPLLGSEDHNAKG